MRRIARILPCQVKGESGLRAGEVRWIGAVEITLWSSEKLEVGESYAVRVDLGEMGRTVDVVLKAAEIHSTQKLRLRPGFLVIGPYTVTEPSQQQYLDELRARSESETPISAPRSSSRASAARRKRASGQVPSPTHQDSPTFLDSEFDDEDLDSAWDSVSSEPEPEAHRPAPPPDTAGTPGFGDSPPPPRPTGSAPRGKRANAPLGPPPTRPKSAYRIKSDGTRKVGSIPLGPPPKRKQPPAPPKPVQALFSAGSPPSLFVQFEDLEKVRGAIQGDPPELAIWLVPSGDLVVGMRLSVAIQLPGGRFVQLSGLVRAQDDTRALLVFPEARPEDLHVLSSSRQG